MWKRPRLMGLVISCLAAGPAAAEPAQSWALWIVQPDRPGQLDSCSSLKTAAAPVAALSGAKTPIRLDQALSIRWHGGYLVQTGEQDQHKPARWNEFDSCFVLTVRGTAVAAGALVRRESARLLRFDTLVLQTDRAGQTLSFSLLPNFPAEIAQPVAPSWTHALAPISAASDTLQR